MKKVFTFLAGVFLCAFITGGASGQSQEIKTAQPEQSSIVAISTTEDSKKVAGLSSAQVAQEIADAKKLLKSHQTSTNIDAVTLAALDPETSEINVFSVSKDAFLVKGANLQGMTQLGRSVRLQVISANGVNTAVTVTDVATGRALVPLVVEYPIVRGGSVTETAFYTSAHPALLSPDIVSAGNTYVTTMLETAAKRLADNGVAVSPDIVNVAEHLVIVEHTDHKRFLNEDRGKIYPEILSLYALNQGDTFRYSVSSAGAGGMIQMIPKTYAGIRQQHPSVNLKPEFVDGMRDHANALEAMLLYVNDTWNYLQKSPEVQGALHNGIAAKAELLAAGYNSNPMRLPAYLKNGGAGWRSLLPDETQMYLSIYSSVDSNVQFLPQPAQEAASEESATSSFSQSSAGRSAATALMSWLSRKIETGGRVLFSRVLS